MNIDELMDQAYEITESKGFWDESNGPRNKAEMIALMHSELSEALEEIRDPNHYDDVIYYSSNVGDGNRKPEGVAVELADVMIRIADFCAGFGIPLELALEVKLKYNKKREYKHGKNF